jgi:flagellar basal body-associated protein FliL
MPPTNAAERTGASGAYYSVPPPPTRRLLPTAGYVGLGVLALFSAFLVIKAVAAFSEGGASSLAPEGYEEVDLGQMTRELAPETGGLVRDPFMLKIVLVLNPKVRDLSSLKNQVEKRRNLYRDIVWSEIINAKSDSDLRKPALVEAMKDEIRQRLNRELGGPKEGQEMISRVIFPDRKPPERR